MGTVYNRLTEARHRLSLTQKAVAERVCLSLRAYARYESGEGSRDIPSPVLDFYAQNGINVNWILTGDGSIYLNAKLALSEFGFYSIESFVYIPLSPITACCGAGVVTYPSDYVLDDSVAVKKQQIGNISQGQLPFAIETTGRSMEGYGIREGSVVIVNPAEPVNTGDVAMVIVDEKASIKKVYRRSDGIDFVSGAGDRFSISYEELQDDHYVRICGKVMLVISTPNEGV